MDTRSFLLNERKITHRSNSDAQFCMVNMVQIEEILYDIASKRLHEKDVIRFFAGASLSLR